VSEDPFTHPDPAAPGANPRVNGATTLALVWVALTAVWLVVTALFWTASAALEDDHNGEIMWQGGAVRILLTELAIAVITGAVVAALGITVRRTSHDPARLSLAAVMIGLALGHVVTLAISGVVLFFFSLVGLLMLLFDGAGDRYFSLFAFGVLSIALDGALIVLAIVCAVQLFRARPVPGEIRQSRPHDDTSGAA
jgi:hypothetical protein